MHHLTFFYKAFPIVLPLYSVEIPPSILVLPKIYNPKYAMIHFLYDNHWIYRNTLLQDYFHRTTDFLICQLLSIFRFTTDFEHWCVLITPTHVKTFHILRQFPLSSLAHNLCMASCSPHYMREASYLPLFCQRSPPYSFPVNIS